MDPQPLRLTGAAAYASTAFRRDLGFLYHPIEAFNEYLRWAGDAADASTIEHNIRVLANRLISLN